MNPLFRLGFCLALVGGFATVSRGQATLFGLSPVPEDPDFYQLARFGVPSCFNKSSCLELACRLAEQPNVTAVGMAFDNSNPDCFAEGFRCERSSSDADVFGLVVVQIPHGFGYGVVPYSTKPCLAGWEDCSKIVCEINGQNGVDVVGFRPNNFCG